MVMWIMIFAIGIVLLGFELSAAVTTLAFLRVAAHERWRLSVAISLSVYVFFFVVFDYWLKIHFPEGWIAEALGLQSLDSYITGPIIRLLTRS
jgi:hypothetical protein